MTDTKPETWLSPPGICPACDEVRGIGRLEPRECDACGAKLFPGDWLTRDGCCYCNWDEVLM